MEIRQINGNKSSIWKTQAHSNSFSLVDFNITRLINVIILTIIYLHKYIEGKGMMDSCRKVEIPKISLKEYRGFTLFPEDNYP